MDTPIADQGIGIHHPGFAKVLKEKMNALGIECEVRTGGKPRNSEEWTKPAMDFINRHFRMK
jgi:hypothetical protein